MIEPMPFHGVGNGFGEAVESLRRMVLQSMAVPPGMFDPVEEGRRMTAQLEREAQGLLDDIIANPADDAPRLIYADWVEDQGDPDRAEFIRVQVELANPISVGTAGSYAETKFLVDLHRAELERRERELFAGSGPKWWNDLPGSYRATLGRDMLVETAEGWKYHVRRGFVESVRLPLQAWLDHGPKLVRAQPITRVEVSDKEPLHYTGLLRAVYAWAGGSSESYLLPLELLWQLDWDGALPSDHSHGYTGWATRQAAQDALSTAALACALAQGE